MRSTPAGPAGPPPAEPGADHHFDARRQDAEAGEGARLRRGIISLLVLGVLVGALVVAVPGLRTVADRLREVSPGWVVLAVALELGSCAGYVAVFRHIFYRVPLVLAVRVALSEMAFGAVLPVGGAGGIAVGAWVAKAKGGSLRRFMERSAVLFLITSGVNAATLAVAGLLVGAGVLHAPHPLLLGLLPGVVGCAGLAFFWWLPDLVARRSPDRPDGRLVGWLRTTALVVGEAREEVRHPGWGLLGAVGYLWFDIAMLWVSFRAFGHPPPVGALTLAFLIGYLGNILPVPGGIGALDAGLTGAMILYGADPATAAAAVLVYHAVVLWIPTLLGTLAFLRLRPTISERVVLTPERPPGARRVGG
ncbi:lysylphosphatidylglycerol synthase transmembrane domain-containing protein [Baekduia soli]|nr:lysylphosphatidylglycerol synthase transmembrane domain-containing protein [Baekduia soli]